MAHHWLSLLAVTTLLVIVTGLTRSVEADSAQRSSRRPLRDRLNGFFRWWAEIAAPKVGMMAPDLRLQTLAPEGDARHATSRLGRFRDRRPIVLFFGSYT